MLVLIVRSYVIRTKSWGLSVHIVKRSDALFKVTNAIMLPFSFRSQELTSQELVPVIQAR